MAYFKLSSEKKVPDQEPFSTYLEFIRKTDSFCEGKKMEYHVFNDLEEHKHCFMSGFYKGIDSENGILRYYIEGPNEQELYYIQLVYSTEFEMDDAHGLIGKWGALNRRFPFFYIQNTVARFADISVVDTEDVNKGRADIRLEAITHNQDCLEGIGCEMLSYMIGILAIED